MLFALGVFVPSVQAAEQKTLTLKVKVPQVKFRDTDFTFLHNVRSKPQCILVAASTQEMDTKRGAFGKSLNSITLQHTTEANANIKISVMVFPATSSIDNAFPLKNMNVSNTGQTITLNIGYKQDPSPHNAPAYFTISQE